MVFISIALSLLPPSIVLTVPPMVAKLEKLPKMEMLPRWKKMAALMILFLILLLPFPKGWDQR